MRNGDDKRLYCCESIRDRDAAGNPHVMCTGVDLSPALNAQGFNSIDVIEQIESNCNRSGGLAPIPQEARQKLESIAKILNIGWIAAGAAKDASIICPRSSACPRDKPCLGRRASRLKPKIDEIRERLLRETVA